ncbi:Iron transporter [Pseudomonas sp. 9Ag]|nr:Iron transporter [Pseudomonas sp. 9Ag]|tara:strand:+ start:138 stop:503 length:366 start_codon:yes stop_codon:yes gene_type:complete
MPGRRLRRLGIFRKTLTEKHVVTRSATQSRSAWPAIAARTLLALLGGYAFTYAFTAALAQWLPLDPVDAVTASSLLSFVVYLTFVLWTFAAASLRRVLIGAGLAIPLAVIGFWPQLLEMWQ